MAGAESIRDVIAFPKTQTATCPLTDAPTEVSEQQLREPAHPRQAARQGLMRPAREPVILVHGLWMNGLGIRRCCAIGCSTSTASTCTSFPTRDARRRRRDRGRPGRASRGGVAQATGQRASASATAWAARSCTERCTERAEGTVATRYCSDRRSTAVARRATSLRHPILRPLLGAHVLDELAKPCGRCWQGPSARARRDRGVATTRHRAVLRAFRRRQRRHRGGRARPSYPGSTTISSCRTATSACCSRRTSRPRWRTSCVAAASPAGPLDARASFGTASGRPERADRSVAASRSRWRCCADC